MSFVAHLPRGALEPGGSPDAGCLLAVLSPLASRAELRTASGAQLCLVGRVRLDRAAELIAPLAARGAAPVDRADHAALCLAAWALWGEAAVEHLHGDFAFVLWDGGARRLFAARDRLGVRGLVAWENAAGWWLGDSLDEVLAAAGQRPTKPDPQWIADFLGAEVSGDPGRTAYADVRRLPPAHVLSITPAGSRLSRYWQFGPAELLRPRSAGAVCEEFRSLLATALAERLPAEGKVGIMLSGGLDSTTLAAGSVDLIGPERVVGRTLLFSLERDPEGPAARDVAAYLGIAHRCTETAGLQYDPLWHEAAESPAEPDLTITQPRAHASVRAAMAQDARVWFYGEGPDNALTFEWRAHLAWLARRRRWLDLAQTGAIWLATKPLAEWATTLAVWSGRKPSWPPPPPTPWVRRPPAAPAIAEPRADTWRPDALANLAGPLWPDMFQGLDRHYAAEGIDWRHPFLDLRLLEFMLRTPPVPWARHKRLLRRAMAGRLPAATLKRRKTPLVEDLAGASLSRAMPPMPRGGPIEAYVSVRDLPEIPADAEQAQSLLRVAVLDHWLRTHG